MSELVFEDTSSDQRRLQALRQQVQLMNEEARLLQERIEKNVKAGDFVRVLVSGVGVVVSETLSTDNYANVQPLERLGCARRECLNSIRKIPAEEAVAEVRERIAYQIRKIEEEAAEKKAPLLVCLRRIEEMAANLSLQK